MDNTRVLLGKAPYFDLIHASRNFEQESLLLSRFYDKRFRIDEWKCATGQLGLSLKHLGFQWHGWEGRSDLRQCAVNKHGPDTVSASFAQAEAESLTQVLGWYSPLSHVSPDELDTEMRHLAFALAKGGWAILEDWLRPEEARSGWALMDTYDGDDYKVTRCAVTQIHHNKAVFPFVGLVAQCGEQPRTFHDEHCLWLHDEGKLLAAFNHAGLKAEKWEIENVNCWKLTKL